MKIAVLGGGNGSFAAAGDLALAGHEVRMWRRDAKAVAAHRDAGGAVLFFAGSEAAFVTGQVLYVCGGASVGTLVI